MKVIFFGTPDFAVPSLETLIGKHEVLAVVTQPDKPKSRGNKTQFTPVKEIAVKYNIPVFQPEKVKNREFIGGLRKFNADIFVTAAYGQFLSEEILNMTEYGSINVHGSLLPKYRGASPIQAAVLNGDDITGVTIMRMVKKLDAGDIILKESFPIEREDTGGTVFDKMSAAGASALITAMGLIESGKAVYVKQDDSQATYAPIIQKHMALIDFSQDYRTIDCFVRAYNPWPIAFTELDGEMLKIYKVEEYDKAESGEYGRISGVTKDGIVVNIFGGRLVITEIQGRNGKRMACSDYLRGHKVTVGQVFKQ